MAIGCGGQLIKILLVILNVIVSLAGLGLVVIGIWFLADDQLFHYLGIASDHGSMVIIQAAASTILVVGFVSLVIGAIGCWGACQQKTSLLVIYAVIIVLIILVEIVGAILAGAFHAKIETTLKKTMNKTVQLDYGRVDAETQGWDHLQYGLACCGVEGPHDWQTSFWMKKTNHSANATVPKTCCVLKSNNLSDPQPKDEEKCYQQALQTNSTSEEYVHHKGCEKGLEDWITGHIYILIGVVVGVILIEVLVVVLACILKVRISRGYEYV